MSTTALLLAISWLPLGLIGAGWYNAFFQRRYPTLASKSDWTYSLLFSLAGPAMLLASLLFLLFEGHGFAYGWSLSSDPRRPEDFTRHEERFRRRWLDNN